MAKNNENKNELRQFLIEQINNNGIQLRDYRNLKDKNRTLDRFNKNPYKETKRAFELENKREERIKNKKGITVDGVVIKESEAIDKALKKLKDDEQIVLRKIDLSPIEDEEEIKSLEDDEKIVLRKIDLTPIDNNKKSRRKRSNYYPSEPEITNKEAIEIMVEEWIRMCNEEGIPITQKDIEETRQAFKESFRKPKTMIEEAQQKLEQRREELNNIPETDKEIIEQINEQDEITKERFKKDKQFEYAFYQGEIVENRIYDMCARASQYKWTSSTNRMWVKGILQESKTKYGELNFYNRLWNMEGETLDNCEKIIWESEGQVGSEEDMEAKNRIANILLNIPVNELEVED